MSETRALKLTFAVILLSVVAAYVGLTLANASEAVLMATVVVIASLAAHILSRVVMHYAPPEERRR